MTSDRGRFSGDSLHQIAVRADAVHVVVDQAVADSRREHLLRERNPDRVRDALPERPRRRFDSRRVAKFRVTGSFRVQLPELLQVVDGDVEAGQVQERVEQHRPMPGAQHEPVTVRPAGILRVEAQMTGPQHVCHRRGAHRHAGVPAVGVFHGVHGQKTDGVDGLLLQLRGDRQETSYGVVATM